MRLRGCVLAVLLCRRRHCCVTDAWLQHASASPLLLTPFFPPPPPLPAVLKQLEADNRIMLDGEEFYLSY